MNKAEVEKKLEGLLKDCGYNTHTHLYYLGDKEWFWDSAKKALIVYRTFGKRRIVLGDPIGNPESVRLLLKEFVSDCKRNRLVPVFYQTNASLLPLYREFGLVCVKIGEEAKVNLSEFHLNGKQWLKLRNRLNKFKRSGYSLKVVSPPYTEDFLHRLGEVSEEWLDGRKEKSFSVGSFSPEYVNRFPVAVLFGPDDTVQAFLSVAGYSPPMGGDAGQFKGQLTVDLMRYTKSCPQGSMDFMFLSLFEWAKQERYLFCSLGMAPLANVSALLIRLLYKHGSKLYNFKGLYEYKNKFAPAWEDIFLVCQPSSVPITAGLLALMINSPVRPYPKQENPSPVRTSDEVLYETRRA